MRRRHPDATDEHVGKRIRMRRLALGMSQQDLAHWVRITFQQIQKYEKGTNRISAGRLHQFSVVLKVPVSFFFEGLPAPDVRSKKHAEPPSADYITDLLTRPEGHALARAFLHVKSSEVRHAIVRFVETMAVRGL
jgi:transcriptional regulator with XRE-family HTH domain